MKVTWIQGDPGFGKTFIAAQILQTVTESFFTKTIQMSFYPQPLSEENNGVERHILRSILPKDADLRQIADTPFFSPVGNAEAVLGCLSDILGEKHEASSPYAQLDKASRAKMRYLVTGLLLGNACLKDRVLLFLEDAHWAGEDALHCLENIVVQAGLDNLRLRIMCTSRQAPPFTPVLNGCLTVFKLEALSYSQSRELLENSASSKKPPDVVMERLHMLAMGCPYFIKEYSFWVRNRLKTGASYEDILREIDCHTPEEITNVLYAKMAGLNRQMIDAVKLAAIQGLHIDPAILAGMAGVPLVNAQALLLKMQLADIVVHNGNKPESGWEFTHELLQKVIYNSMTEAVRNSLHLQAIAHIRGRNIALRENVHPLLAWHAARTGIHGLEYIHAKEAGRRANARSKHETALQYFAAAQKALDRIKDGTPLLKHKTIVKFLELESLFILGRYAAVKTRLDDILGNKAILPGPDMLRETMSFQGLYFWLRGEIPKAAKTYAAILKNMPKSSGEGPYLRESARLSHIYIDLGQYRKSIKFLKIAVELLENNNPHAKYGMLTEMGPTLLSCLALAHAELGEQEAFNSYYESARKQLAETEDYFTRIYVSTFLSHSLIILDRHQEARPLLEDALVYCSAVQSDLLRPYVLSAYGIVTAKLGRVDEGRRFCEQAIDLAKKSNLMLRRSLFKTWHAETLMLGGNYSAAVKELRKAIKSAVASGEEGRLAYAYYLMAGCYINLESPGSQEYNFFSKKALSFAQGESAAPLEKKIQEAEATARVA